MARAYSKSERDTKCKHIEELIGMGLSDSAICEQTGISIRTLYNWRSSGYIKKSPNRKPGIVARSIDMHTAKSDIYQNEKLDGTPLPYKEEPDVEIPFAGDDAFADACNGYCELEPVQGEKAKTVPLLKREVKISGDYIEVTEKNGAFKMELLGSVESDGKGGLMDVLNQIVAECRGMMAELEG